MKKSLFLLLAMAGPAFAEDGIYSRTEYAGHVRNWPPVVEACEAYRRCPAEDMAIIESQRLCLTYASPSLYSPLVGRTSVTAPPAQPVAPAPLPPMAPTAPRSSPSRP